jgi:putative phosphoribosyl transferase
MVRYQYNEEVRMSLNNIILAGDLTIPEGADNIIVFAHGSGSGRHSSRNQFVASVLQKNGFATLLFDLLTIYEDRDYARRFDIELLSERLIKATQWLKSQSSTMNLSIGYFGASTGAAAAFEAAAKLGEEIKAIVSRGGRPDLAANVLPQVKAPTQLIVGSLDSDVVRLNKNALFLIEAEKELIVVEGATHLFEEPGKLKEVADHASEWFARHLIKAVA